MLFTSYSFLAFLAVLFVTYYLVPRKLQWGVLLVFSLVFYAMANPAYLLHMGIVIIATYFTALKLEAIAENQRSFLALNSESLSKDDKKEYKQKAKAKQRAYLLLGLFIDFGVLLLLKYIPWSRLLDCTGTEATTLLIGDKSWPLGILLLVPMGISFYTLQITGYLFDVYRGQVKAERNFFKLCLFTSFFPQLIQGPISRFGDLSESLFGHHSFDTRQFMFGIERIMWGFFKKLVIADRLAAGVLTIMGDFQSYRGAYVLVGMFLYTLQLYADFTGGIDVTIGVAQSLGITIKENFMRPYFAKSLKEYWRRWHITMCDWFRIYVFFPVSTSKWLQKFSKWCRNHLGEKVGKRIPVYLASFLVWFATGLWHGGSLNFLVWGLLNWFILMISEEFEPWSEHFHEKHNLREKAWFRGFQMLRTFLLVVILNLFDCYVSVKETLSALVSIFTTGNYGILTDGSLLQIGLSMADYLVLFLGVLVMFAVSWQEESSGSLRTGIAMRPFLYRMVIYVALFLVVLVFGVYGIGYDGAQFIYNRF